MFLRRSGLSVLLAAASVLAAGPSRAEIANLPPAVQALEKQGLTVVQEFKAGQGMRAFAASAGDHPVAVYVTADGDAILGTRVDANGNPVDEQVLQQSVVKPMNDKSWAQLAGSTWVRDGKDNAPRVIYVFTDANCVYCHQFWQAARPWVDAGKVQLRHIMVGVISADSPAKAAAILDAPDPSAALLKNERAFEQGGIAPAKSVPQRVQKVLDANQVLMLAMGFRGTPGIVVQDDQGLLKKYNGMPREAVLDQVFGPR